MLHLVQGCLDDDLLHILAGDVVWHNVDGGGVLSLDGRIWSSHKPN